VRSGHRLPAALVVAAVGALASAGCGSAPAPLEAEPVERVLVVSLPGLDWNDVAAADLPNLDAFV
jgi:hypothetical protein